MVTRTETSDPGTNLLAWSSALDEERRRAIHRAACEFVASAVERRPASQPDASLGDATGIEVMGAFVSLKRRGRLRACCGFFGGRMSLAEAISQAARRTATEDVRLPQISPTELKYLDVEVWILDGFQPIASQGAQRVNEVVIGRHGLQIRRGTATGLLLPGVAVEYNLDPEGFLQHVCEKAGLHPTAWKEDDTQLFTFEGHVIAASFDPSIAEATAGMARTVMTGAVVARLADHARRNLLALMRGAMTSCYTFDCPDGTVHGLCLALRLPGIHDVQRFSKLSIRPGLALQSTLYTLTEMASRALAGQGIDPQALADVHVDLTVLCDPAMHGTIMDPALEGFDPTSRALLAVDGARSAWIYQPGGAPNDLVNAAAHEAEAKRTDATSLLSFAAASTEGSALVSFVPRPQSGPKVRPAAVAGSFYPSSPDALSELTRALLSDTGMRESWPAIMVPHAGLQYSGKIAAEVFQRVEIPEVLIILGPRHRPVGMEFAVAPHETWSLPGLSVASDPDLARQLVEGIPGLHLDAAAHQQEHSIEVQLPLLAQIAPHARVVGITVGPADLERCRQIAASLASVLRTLGTKPLLVISSDLNHYASDAETRRLDEIALSALESLDPACIHETMTTQKISMCGLLPTVIVLEILRQMGTLTTSQRLGYATSADATGDKSRVVGYAGMLFG